MQANQIAEKAETTSRQPENASGIHSLLPFSISQHDFPGRGLRTSTEIGDHSRYIDKSFIHELSTDLKGLPVESEATSTGIRYIILLSPLPRLPEK